LKNEWNFEIIEQHKEDKQIVHRKTLFDQESCLSSDTFRITSNNLLNPVLTTNSIDEVIPLKYNTPSPNNPVAIIVKNVFRKASAITLSSISLSFRLSMKIASEY